MNGLDEIIKINDEAVKEHERKQRERQQTILDAPENERFRLNQLKRELAK